MNKLLFVITSLEIGGAEKSLVNLVNNLDGEIEILTLYPNGKLEDMVNNSIKITSIFNKKYLEYSKVLRLIIGLIFRFNFLVKLLVNNQGKYDYVISFLEGPAVLVANNIYGNKKFGFIHTMIDDNMNSKFKLNNQLKIYRKFDKVICVTKTVESDLNSRGVVNTLVIGNIVNIEEIIAKSNEYSVEFDKFTFVVVARLTSAKGIERLVEIHSMLVKKLDYQIIVIGEGELCESISDLITKLNVSDSFILKGSMLNPYPYIKSASCILLPSIYEGASIVGIETMVLNNSIISTNTGASEVLDSYDNAIIVDNSFEAILNAMKLRISSDKKLVEYEYCDNNMLEIRRLFNE